MKNRGINSEQAKRTNRLLVLQNLSMTGGASRTELTRRVGLAKMTVTNITAELIRSGILRESQSLGHDRPGAGRPQMLLSFTPKAPAVIGIWLSRDACTGILADMALKVLETRTLPLSAGETAETLLDKFADLCASLRGALSPGQPLLGAGIASIGPLDLQNGSILNPPNFGGLHDIPVCAALSERLDLPVFLENDTNAAALAEKYFGCCASCSNFVYVGLTNGLSAGIVLRDALLHGQHGFAGELGHTVVDPAGAKCYCGRRGCLETLVTASRLLREAEGRFGYPFRDFAQLCRFCESRTEGEEWLAGKLEPLALALANLANLVDPECILLGHEGACLPDRILDLLARRVNAEVLAGERAGIRIGRSSFGPLAAVYGAAVVVLKKVFDGELGYAQFFREA